jgi:spore germination protein YaaH/flagellar hook assembly protein FlgD
LPPPRIARPRHLIASRALAVAVLLGAVTLPAATAAEPAPAADPGLLPGVHYKDAMAHADDRIEFRPGGRVAVGFVPRAGDPWDVDGARPRALPAGHATGSAMAATAQGTPWAGRAATATEAARVEPAAAPVRTAGSRLLRHVFGFLPYWELSDSSTSLNYELLSTIAYFSVGADPAGNLLKRNPDGSTTVGWSGWTSARLTDVITAAHRNGTRVVLTISMFAWTTGQRDRQAALLGSPAARLNLARQAAAAVRDRGADGINLDFEPLVSGYEDEFTALVRTMRTELNRIAPGYQLTFDTMGFIGNYPIEDATAPGGADAIFIMGYDYRTASSSPVGSIAPLGGPRYDIVDTVRAYADRVAPSKLILGVPYYGRAWSTSSSALNSANISGTKYGVSAAVVYANAMPLLAQHGRRWDSREQVAWTVYRRETCTPAYGCVTSWRQLYVDDVAALRAKYDVVIRYGLRGAGIWALGYDDQRPELDQVLAQKFLHDTAGPVAGIGVLGLAQREEAFRVGWPAYDISGVASWDVQVSRDGGPWGNWLLRTALTGEWFTGAHGHGYAFRVRATDRKGNVGPWNVVAVYGPSDDLVVGGFARVEVDGLAMREAPGTAAIQVGELDALQRLQVVGGPVAADGHTWWQVAGPLTEWRPVMPLGEPAWVAQGPAGDPYLSASRAPHTTAVDAPLRTMTFGDAGNASLGVAGAAHRTFSPNGDGSRDTLRLRWTNGVALDALELRILAANGTLIGSIPLATTEAGAQVLDFDGRVSGTVLPDGRYVLAVVGTIGSASLGVPSRAVTGSILAAYGVTVDTVAPTLVRATRSGWLLSPNGDGRHDWIGFGLTGTGASGWSFTVQPLVAGAPGAAIRTVRGAGGVMAVRWHGRTDGGALAPDGTYRVTVAVSDAAGNQVGRSWDILLDNTRPRLALTAAPGTITPNGDGRSDATTLRWTGSEGVTGRVRVMRAGTTVRTWTFTARTAWSVRWAGRDGRGRLLPDGTYTIRVDGLDRAGNAGAAAARVVIR